MSREKYHFGRFIGLCEIEHDEFNCQPRVNLCQPQNRLQAR